MMLSELANVNTLFQPPAFVDTGCLPVLDALHLGTLLSDEVARSLPLDLTHRHVYPALPQVAGNVASVKAFVRCRDCQSTQRR